jgi:GGDEF domain-containing protein
MNDSEGSLGLTGADIKRWKEFRPVVDEGAKKYLQIFFGDSLNLFWNETEKKGNPKWRSLAESFFVLAFDPGLRRKISLSLPNGETNATGSTYMLGRASGIDWLKRKTNFRKDGGNFSAQQFHILRFDINGVFQANQFQQGKGGDYLINQVASGLNESIANITGLPGGVEIIPSRYGGDEFVVYISGNINPEQRNQIVDKIKEAIKGKKAYFGENGEERNIGLKEDKIEVIDPSQIVDESKKQLFYLFLSRGNVLSLDELNAECERIIAREGDVKNYLQKESAQKRIYPPDVETLEQKIDYFTGLHPEFKVPFYLAWWLDKKEGKTERQENLLSLMESDLIDPLLDRIAMNRRDLPEHLRRSHLQEIWSFEVKLKEMNEHEQLGYTYADEAVKGAWEKIKLIFENKFGNDWEKKILVGRFGGTIFIGLREGSEELSGEELKQLQEIKVEVDGITHDVGFAKIRAEKISEQDNAETIKQKIEETVGALFTEPSKDWHGKKAGFLQGLNVNEVKIFSNKLESREFEIKELEIEDKNKRVNLELLLKYFLNEKRGSTRRKDFINEIPEEIRSKLSWLIEIFQKIENEKQNQSSYL